MNNYDEKTLCQGYDNRCNGCIYEHRWKVIMFKEPDDRIKIQKTMNFLDPGECASIDMEWKELKSSNKGNHGA